MSKFIFRLAALLRLRESTRDQCRAALAEAYRVDDALGKQLQRVAAELEALRKLRRQAAGPGTVNVDQLVEAHRYELAAGQQQLQLTRQRQTVATEIERRRQTLVEADREVRVLEKLRQRQADQHRLDEERKELKRLDEIAAQRAMREVAT
ncbi:MAG: flagellar export protein FliJ [Thermoguttaceae bacterium]|jgi:flagellar FliJ protein